MFLDINDYELLYLIKENNEKALNLMYYKYGIYIKKKIIEMKIPKRFFEEYLQEGFMCLYNAIDNFKEIYNKTFFCFFDLILSRKFFRLRNKSYEYQINVSFDLDIDLLGEEVSSFRMKEHNFDGLSNLEKNLLKDVIIGGLKPIEVANIYNLNVKKIYNALFSLKNKCKKNNEILTKQK